VTQVVDARRPRAVPVSPFACSHAGVVRSAMLGRIVAFGLLQRPPLFFSLVDAGV
jgi:hypothetical protein